MAIPSLLLRDPRPTLRGTSLGDSRRAAARGTNFKAFLAAIERNRHAVSNVFAPSDGPVPDLPRDIHPNSFPRRGGRINEVLLRVKSYAGFA